MPVTNLHTLHTEGNIVHNGTKNLSGLKQNSENNGTFFSSYVYKSIIGNAIEIVR